MTVPLHLGGQLEDVRIFELVLELVPPAAEGASIRWTALVAARRNWRLPFAVLLGQRGWFDRFPTTVDATSTWVHVVD